MFAESGDFGKVEQILMQLRMNNLIMYQEAEQNGQVQ